MIEHILVLCQVRIINVSLKLTLGTVVTLGCLRSCDEARWRCDGHGKEKGFGRSLLVTIGESQDTPLVMSIGLTIGLSTYPRYRQWFQNDTYPCVNRCGDRQEVLYAESCRSVWGSVRLRLSIGLWIVTRGPDDRYYRSVKDRQKRIDGRCRRAYSQQQSESVQRSK